MQSLAPEAPFAYRALQRAIQTAVCLLTRTEATGIENIPAAGPVIVAINHLHTLDLPIAFVYVPRLMVIFAADKYRGKLGGWVMQFFTKTIFVARGEPDRQALGAALDVLKSGGAVAIAPEGTRSRTGGLLEGRRGAVYLAARSGAVIVPMAMWGQETIMPGWARLRRAHVHARIGVPIVLPAESARYRTAELDAHTEELMLALARMLPEEYRGVYADKVRDIAP